MSIDLEEYHVDQDELLDHQRIRWERVKEAGGGRLELDLIANETAGGKCPSCGAAWEKVEVENRYAEYEYYQPSCRCFGNCDKCGKSLHGVSFPNHPERAYRCPSCGYAGEDRWVLLCHRCGLNATKHTGKYYEYICNSCMSDNKKSRKKALEV